VVVVKDERKRCGGSGKIIDEERKKGIKSRGFRRLKLEHSKLADRGVDELASGHNIAPEAYSIVVRFCRDNQATGRAIERPTHAEGCFA